jgi:hypothetical protein
MDHGVLVVTIICIAGIAFMVSWLVALSSFNSREHPSKADRVSPVSTLDWDIELEESMLPGDQHAVPEKHDWSSQSGSLGRSHFSRGW